MNYVKKLLQIEEGLYKQVSDITAKEAEIPLADEIVQARNFLWFYGKGGMPKEEMKFFHEMIRKDGREKAEKWLDNRRAAFAREVDRVRAALALKHKGFERFAPSETQTICLLLRWAVENAPRSVLAPSPEDLANIAPRNPSDEPPPTAKKRTPKAATSRR